MDIDEHHDWTDDFETCEQVWACLQDDWAGVVDVTHGLELERDPDALLVVEIAQRLRARQRRAFAPARLPPFSVCDITTWRWDVAETVSATDPADFPQPLSLYEQLDPPARPSTYARLRVRVATEGLVSQVTRQVLQDVFRSAPADVDLSGQL